MNDPQPVKLDRRQAFALVELLVVIVVLGMLAGLTSTAVYSAIVRAKITTIALPLNQLDQAAGHAASQNGLYPPDFTGSPAEVDRAVQHYLQRAFTQYDATNWRADMAAAGIQATDPASALLSRRTRWANPDSCQIRGSGFDLTHGTGVAFPLGTDYDEAQRDNATNFTSGTLKDRSDD